MSGFGIAAGARLRRPAGRGCRPPGNTSPTAATATRSIRRCCSLSASGIRSRRDARDGVLAVRVHRRVEHAHRPAGDAWWAEAMNTILRLPGIGFGLEGAVRLGRRVAPDGDRVGAVGPHGPEVLVRDGVAVNVVPAREQDLAGVRHGREPFADVVEREDAQAGAVGVHPVQRVAVPALAEVRPEAARVAAPPRRDERDAAVGQVAGHQVVVAAARELAQAGAVHVDLVDVEVAALVALFVDRQRRASRAAAAGRRRRRTRCAGRRRKGAVPGSCRRAVGWPTMSRTASERPGFSSTNKPPPGRCRQPKYWPTRWL